MTLHDNKLVSGFHDNGEILHDPEFAQVTDENSRRLPFWMVDDDDDDGNTGRFPITPQDGMVGASRHKIEDVRLRIRNILNH